MAPPRQTGSGFFAVLHAMLEVRHGVCGRGREGASGREIRAWAGSWRGGGVALIVLCLAVYLPGLWSIPPVDRDESRFAQASRTMLESGDFVVPRIGATPRLNKPPLIYWLQCASAVALGDGPGVDGLGQWGNGNIWVFRLPSVLCAIGSVLLTWRLGLRMFDPRAAALGAAFLAASPMVIWDAHQARADQLLLFTTTGAMLALFDCWKRTSVPSHASPERSDGSNTPRPRISSLLALDIFVALGILAKGPITPMIVLLTALVLSITSRNFRWLLKLNPLFGLIIIAAIVGPWVYLVGERVGWSVYLRTVYDETIGRGTEAKENHWGPPGYHLVLLTVLFWPGSLLTAAGFVRAWRRGLSRFRVHRCPEAFLLAWVVPSWLVFELLATKLPHYTMPLYPAIALLSARMAFAASAAVSQHARTIGARIGSAIWGGVGFTALLLSAAAVVAFGGIELENGRYWALGTAVAGFALCTGLALHGLRAGRFLRAHVLAIWALVLWCWLVLGWAVPSAQNLRVSGRVIAAMREVNEHKQLPMAVVGYQEDSAIFLGRGRVDRVTSAEIGHWVESRPLGAVAIDTTATDGVNQLQARGWLRRTRIEGYNYSIGKRVVVDVYAPGEGGKK